MGSKIIGKSCLTTHPLEIFLLVLFFLTVNLFILSHYQEKSLKTLQNAEKPGRETQILTFVEDGRSGSLLQETSTLDSWQHILLLVQL